MNSPFVPTGAAKPTQSDADFLLAQQLLQQGQTARASALLQSTLMREPAHQPSLRLLAQLAMGARDMASAQQCLEKLAELEPSNLQHWLQLAMLHRAGGDAAKEERALFQVLCIDARDLMALLMRGDLFERQGRNHDAAKSFQAAVAVAPDAEKLPPPIRAMLVKAHRYCERYNQSYSDQVESLIANAASQFSGAELDRFRLSLDIMFGRKKRYESQPMNYFFPQLAPVEFFERRQFPWMEALEARTEQIREEFLAVLQGEQGFIPYLSYSEDQPLNQWVELNNSPQWSAFHLLKDGLPVAENASRCPATMAAMALAPQPDQPGRTPVGMFSLLKPRTRIPPHVGVSNARLVTHLPLIIPPNCGFRVGNTTRQWEPGRAWVFDDTIEHEAWNNSDLLRVVLIFDVWHPGLSEAERVMISAMSAAFNQFAQSGGGFDL